MINPYSWPSILFILKIVFALAFAHGLSAQDKAEIDILETLARDIKSLNVRKSNLQQQLIEMNTQTDIISLQQKAAQQRHNQFTREMQHVGAMLAHDKQKLIKLFAALQRLHYKMPAPTITASEETLAAIRASILIGSRFRTAQHEALEKRGKINDLRQSIRLEKAHIDSQRKTLDDIRAQQQSLETDIASLANTISTQTGLYWREYEQFKDNRSQPLPEQAQLGTALAQRFSHKQLMNKRPFADLKNRLALPAEGLILSRFGEALRHGDTSQGLIVATQKGGIITAPVDAEVVFAAPFRAYGEMVVLGLDEGYTITIAGLGARYVNPGDFVLAGEPLGKMTSQHAALSGQINLKSTQPLYYLEIRQKNQSLDPSVWLQLPANRAF